MARSWFRGKRGGLLAFAIVAGLVGGGLGWVTLAALRLEREQMDDRAANELANKIRLATWRLDSRIITLFALEANRPYHHYALDATSLIHKTGKGVPALDILELAPAAGTQDPPWMQQHFLVARRSDWGSTRVLVEALVQRLGILKQSKVATKDATAREQLLEWALTDAQVRQILTPSSSAQTPAPLNTTNQYLGNYAGQPGDNNLATNNDNPIPGQVPQRFDKDTASRFSRAQAEIGQAAARQPNMPPANNVKYSSQNQVLAILGTPVPLWVTAGQEDRLVVTRQVQVGDKLACQVTLLDWHELHQLLKEEVHDLLPDMRLTPIRDGVAPAPERAMAALPVEVDPGPPPAPAAGLRWTPLRIGLLMAWAAALVGLAAVGLGGWSLLNLSERRIRFVSAVTHELRTPLTTLRLYLDMLATGLVREETQKTEYIQTLNTEADRLNRLVGNVLDFSRLENQRPRLEKAPIVLGDLLGQIEATWQGRCQTAGKELVIENNWGPEVVLFTDVQLVNQILGNLIDNACKYSRGAADHRIWVRSRCSDKGRLVLEVEDRGFGVPPQERRSIFRPFRRGHTENVSVGGVGLGLALARRWVKLLGGKLTLHCPPEKVGACFRVELPCPAA